MKKIIGTAIGTFLGHYAARRICRRLGWKIPTAKALLFTKVA